MEFLELARNRYSERSFAAKPVEEEKLYKILEAGRIAPTACNNQPQRFYVLKSRDALNKAAKLTHTYNAPVVILVCYVESDAWHNPRDGFCSGDMDASIAASSMMFEAEMVCSSCAETHGRIRGGAVKTYGQYSLFR